MSDVPEIRDYVLVFNCVSCGTLLSCDNGQYGSAVTCPNCGAFYSHDSTGVIYQYGAGRVPTQWFSNGYQPVKE